MEIIFYEQLEINNDLRLASARMLFSTITDQYIPREKEEIIYQDECYRVIKVSSIYQYDAFTRKESISHIDILVRKL